MPEVKTSKIKFRDKFEATFKHRPNPFDQLFTKEIWTDECYFKGGYDIKPGDQVIDIGGHIGLFTVLAAKLGANVRTYEPVPENFDFLLQNIKENGVLDKVNAFNKAVTADGREVSLHTFFDDPKWNTGAARVLEEGKIGGLKAPSVKFDDVFREAGMKCDFLKLDCEGSEYEILYGGASDIFKLTKIISMEFHYSLQQGKMLANFLEKKGFNVNLRWAYGSVGLIQARRK